MLPIPVVSMGNWSRSHQPKSLLSREQERSEMGAAPQRDQKHPKGAVAPLGTAGNAGMANNGWETGNLAGAVPSGHRHGLCCAEEATGPSQPGCAPSCSRCASTPFPMGSIGSEVTKTLAELWHLPSAQFALVPSRFSSPTLGCLAMGGDDGEEGGDCRSRHRRDQLPAHPRRCCL